jgi:hypothetical protein
MLKHLLSTTFRRTALLALMAFVSVAAYAQQIDMSLEKVTVRKALEHLQREYNYSVSVRSDEIDIDRVVSVKSQGGASLTAVLNQIFAGQDVTYPSGVALAPDGTLYVIDGTNMGTVRKISYIAD